MCVFDTLLPVSCEAADRGWPAAGAEVHMDGEEHRSRARSEHTGAWLRAAEPLLLLAEEGCVGRAQGDSREQAVDLAEEDDHSSQSGHGHHQSLAAEWWQSVLNSALHVVIF